MNIGFFLLHSNLQKKKKKRLKKGLGFLKTDGKYKEVAIKRFYLTNTRGCCCCVSKTIGWRANVRSFFCTEEIENADIAYDTLTNQVLQVGIVKPLATLVEAIIYQVNSKTHRIAFNLLNAVSAISVIIALIALLRVYKATNHAPGLPLKNHNVVSKFIILKALFFLLIVNNLLFEPLIEGNSIPIPDWLCAASVQDYYNTDYLLYCQV